MQRTTIIQRTTMMQRTNITQRTNPFQSTTIMQRTNPFQSTTIMQRTNPLQRTIKFQRTNLFQRTTKSLEKPTSEDNPDYKNIQITTKLPISQDNFVSEDNSVSVYGYLISTFCQFLRCIAK